MVALTYRLEGDESDDNKIKILMDIVIRAVLGGNDGGDASLSNLAILTGSGIEIETTGEGVVNYSIQPTIAHALASYIRIQGGVYITTNITDTALLTMSEDKPDISFIALQGTLLDLMKGRNKSKIYHRPRSYNDLIKMAGTILDVFLQGKGLSCPIPLGIGEDVLQDDDQNLIDARTAIQNPNINTLLITGNSLLHGTNGMGLRFVSSGKSNIHQVIMIDPDANRDAESVKIDLIGYGLSPTIEVHRVIGEANTFVNQLVDRLEKEEPGIRTAIEKLIDSETIKSRRQLIGFPPKEIVCTHKVANRFYMTTLYELMMKEAENDDDANPP